MQEEEEEEEDEEEVQVQEEVEKDICEHKVVNLVAVDCEKVKEAVKFITFMWSGEWRGVVSGGVVCSVVSGGVVCSVVSGVW